MRAAPYLLLALLFFPEPTAAAESVAMQKRAYHLFSPVPNSLLRDLSAERPGVTESPTTLDAGHIQLDTGLIDYGFDNRGDEDEESLTVLETTLGIGLTRRTAAQIILTPYGYEKSGASTMSGFGDLTLRLKVNGWGNDPEPGQHTAFGIIPEVTIPTGTEISITEVEGALTGAFAWHVSDHWNLSSHLQFEFVYDEDRRSYDTNLVHTLMASLSVLSPIELQIEYVGKATVSSSRGYRPALGTSVMYHLSENLQLDAEMRVGFGSSPDYESRRSDTGRVTAQMGFTYRH